jgi:hypothetical protein
MTSDLVNALKRVATFELDHVPSRPQIDWSTVNAEELWSRSSRERMTGLLIAELRASGNDDSVPDALIDRLEPRAIERVGLLTELEWYLVELIELLRSAGVAAAAVKGPALGRSLYPVQWWRDFGDLDLLVAAADFNAAIGALESAGAALIVAPPSRRAVTLLGKGVTLRHPRGFEIDLHHTLLSGSLGFGLGWDWWMGHGTVVDVGGSPVATTGTVKTALHLLAHLCIGGPVPSLHVARDVAQSLSAIDPVGSAGQCLIDSVTAAGLDGLIQAALSRVETIIGWRHQGWIDWSAGHPNSAQWERVQRRFASEQASFGAVVTASWRVHARRSERLAILRAIAWPDTAYLAGRGLSRQAHLVHFGHTVARGRRAEA